MIPVSDNIKEYINSVFGEEYLNKFLEYINSEYNSYVRITGKENEKEILINNLKSYGIKLEQIPGLTFAYKILEGHQTIGKTFEHALGKYYIQSLSSMIPPFVLNPQPGEKVLDLCAAPGSKTTQLAAFMNNRGTLIANEPNLQRVKALIYNLDRLSFVNLAVIKDKGELLSKFYENYFDKILVDAPCSALGIIQKKGEVSNWWNLNQAGKIAELQFRLLLSAVKMAKVGAEIVYSTCTLTLEENEIILNKIFKKYPVELIDFELPLKTHEGFIKFGDEELNPEIKKSKRIIPWEINSEGFFVAKLKKTGETEAMKKAEVKNRGHVFLSANNSKIKKYLNDIKEQFGIAEEVFHQYKYLIKTNDIYFINSDWDAEDLNPFMRVGIKFASVDNKDIAQLYSNAASIFENKATKNIVELTDMNDLKIYMSGGIIKREFAPPGQKIIKYKNYFIGTAVASHEGLKSRFPRAMRTGEIIL
ncbi:MAG: hypothetical protein A2068_12380 [Ignavibacteria bacterium GWB2_35_6b]|nr:MAG: hypothetical protein A2068_12380 [Ignavibacteria bacterium GWB2_35_6b]